MPPTTTGAKFDLERVTLTANGCDQRTTWYVMNRVDATGYVRAYDVFVVEAGAILYDALFDTWADAAQHVIESIEAEAKADVAMGNSLRRCGDCGQTLAFRDGAFRCEVHR